MEKSVPLVAVGGEVGSVEHKAASTLAARDVRPTTGLLSASKMTLHVGLGLVCLRNVMRMWRRRSRGSEYFAWMASTSQSRKFSRKPRMNDSLSASSSSSRIFPASPGVSVLSKARSWSGQDIIGSRWAICGGETEGEKRERRRDERLRQDPRSYET